MSFLGSIAINDASRSYRPVDQLDEAYGLSPSAARMYQRYYGLEQVAQADQDLAPMLSDCLSEAVASIPAALRRKGHLFYCKTQTHNTLSDRNWLRGFADDHGLKHWDVSSLTMTSCASALVAVHFARRAKLEGPLIILTGEKAFHPWVSRLTVGLLGELPSAGVFYDAGALPDEAEGWQIIGSSVRHMPRYFRNPDAMDKADRAALQAEYNPAILDFIEQSIAEYGSDLPDDFRFVPHNLNAPVTQAIIRHFGWEDRVFQGPIDQVGHGYCADSFINLNAFTKAHPVRKRDETLLVFAAGTGITLATCLLRHSPSSSSSN